MFSTIIRFMQEGGAFMYPIALVLLLGLAIAIERWLYLTRMRISNQSLWKQLEPLLASGNFRQAAQLSSQSSSSIGQILNYGLARIQGARRRDDIEKAMDESLLGIVPRLERRTHYLASFANVATLLGLLGTIIGLIVAIPLLMMHSVLQSKTTALIDNLELASVKFLNSVTERSAAPQQQD